jgi:hypothetical protein
MDPSKSLIKEFLEGGWLVPFVGAAAMLARLLSANQKVTIGTFFKRIAVAAIASGVAWFVLEQTEINSLYKAVIYGVIGVISPEVIDGVVAIGKKFANNPDKFIRKP